MARGGDPTIAAGDLDKRITLLAPVYNDYDDDAVVPQETNEAGRQIEITLLSIVIRYRRDIDARWRIQDHEHLYQIKGIQDVARRRVHLELSCQEVL